MIGKLRGLIDSVFEDYAIIDVHGVGYRVFCSSKTLSFLQSQQGEVSLTIETNVKEDHIHLFGFINQQEKDIFTKLCTVNGVGSKMCIKIMSVLTIEERDITKDTPSYTWVAPLAIAQDPSEIVMNSRTEHGLPISFIITPNATRQLFTTIPAYIHVADA